MALGADDLAAIRAHIGTGEPPTDAELDAAWSRLGQVEAVALEVVRSRLADLRARPTELSVDGDYTERWTGTIAALERQEARLVSAVIAGSGQSGIVKVARLTRGGRSR